MGCEASARPRQGGFGGAAVETKRVMTNTPLLKAPHDATDTLILADAVPDPGPTAGRLLLPACIAGLTLAVFMADVAYPEYLHIGVLFNVCIALTLWSWRPRWVVAVTTLTVALRLASYALERFLPRLAHLTIPGFTGEEPAGVDVFNLAVGVAVQTLTGALIWRQVEVQKRLEVREQQTRRQAHALKLALDEATGAKREAENATREAQKATDRERAALQREVEARRRERKTFHALERVKDLSLALSRAVLPDVPALLAGGRVGLAARYEPAEQEIQIGGDFYDVLTLDDSGARFGLVIGDVAGHGVEAAAQTALVTTTLRACAFGSEDGPADVLSRTARTLEGQTESFVSLFYGVLDADAGHLTYANAGHEPPILLDGADSPTPLNPTGPLLGLGFGPARFGERRLALRPGQTLVLMTDGLTEVRCGGGEMLDWEGLAGIAARRCAAAPDAAAIADGILADVRAYAARERLTDDVALVVACVLS